MHFFSKVALGLAVLAETVVDAGALRLGKVCGIEGAKAQFEAPWWERGYFLC